MTSPYRLALLTEPPTWQGRPLSGRSLDLLAVLAGSHDARVSDAALIEALWPDDAPARPLRALHVVVSRLRTVVGEGVVERSGDGYRLELAEAEVDIRTWRAGRTEPGPAPPPASGSRSSISPADCPRCPFPTRPMATVEQEPPLWPSCESGPQP